MSIGCKWCYFRSDIGQWEMRKCHRGGDWQNRCHLKKMAAIFKLILYENIFFIFIIHFKFVPKDLMNNSHILTLIICYCKVMAESPKRYRSRSKSLCATHPLMLVIITECRMDQQTDGMDGVHQIYPQQLCCVCVWYNNSLIIIILNKT